MRSTDHPARSIAEPHRNLPQRHEAPTALLHHVISRTRLEALRTAAMNSLVRLHPDFNPGRYPAAQTNALVNKSHKMLNPVEDGFNFQLHRWSPARWFAFVFNSQTTRIHSDQRLPFYPRARPRPLGTSNSRLRLEPRCEASRCRRSRRLRATKSKPNRSIIHCALSFSSRVAIQVRHSQSKRNLRLSTAFHLQAQC